METAGRPEAIKTESVWREFWREQVPLVVVTLAAGLVAVILAAWISAGGRRRISAFRGGVKVPIWHLVWMGFWTGYTMGVVGEAAGIFALPYQISILQFGNAHVTPTTQLLTLLNPLGALLDSTARAKPTGTSRCGCAPAGWSGPCSARLSGLPCSPIRSRSPS
jgi:hypothetical protein